MANKFTRFLQGFANGFAAGGTRGMPGDYQHAARLFIDDSLRLSPRTKFNYFVRFDIDATAHTGLEFSTKDANTVGLLVKSTDLPSYTFQTETINQYNRKKIIYKMMDYDPLTFKFHDDSHGVTNALWALYYAYYVRDRSLPIDAYFDNKYAVAGSGNFYRYGLDNNISTPFFRKIHLYTMSRQRFLEYTLINPRITKWQHSDMDYAATSEPAENTMTVEFEAVQYGGGRVDYNTPSGFANLHYDSRPSSLSVLGGGSASLLGTGGVLDGLEQIFGAVSNGSAFDSPQNFLSTAISAVNTYQNIKSLSKEDLKREAINVLTNPAAVSGIVNTIGGVANTVIKKNDPNAVTTPAISKPLINPADER